MPRSRAGSTACAVADSNGAASASEVRPYMQNRGLAAADGPPARSIRLRLIHLVTSETARQFPCSRTIDPAERAQANRRSGSCKPFLQGSGKRTVGRGGMSRADAVIVMHLTGLRTRPVETPASLQPSLPPQEIRDSRRCSQKVVCDVDKGAVAGRDAGIAGQEI